MTIRTDDGLVWTYCHLALPRARRRAGARSPPATQIGLVGSTGHATGPHLHLQLQPPTKYPQNQAWFQSFAGTAFHWQDAPPSARIGDRRPRAGLLRRPHHAGGGFELDKSSSSPGRESAHGQAPRYRAFQ